mmetsp:Transcript_58763/g.108456  ORF Transcript_58763/g.108456 Transcript_58763/m.108456 type:complete len:307 (+) Transcript_58763:94-1014(+)
MARDAEKAATAFTNRWIAQKRDLERANSWGKSTDWGGALLPPAEFGPFAPLKRPKLAAEVRTVRECEHWRSEIVRGLVKKVAEVQNAALGEHRLRDLNDEINKDLREKAHWEQRISALGGQQHKVLAPSEASVYGAELAAHSGYKYFGAAKDLPGVRELFEQQEVPPAPRKSRKQLFRSIQPDYYGWRDDDDATVLVAERDAENRLIAQAVAGWGSDQTEHALDGESEENLTSIDDGTTSIWDKSGKRGPAELKSYVDLPSMQELQQLILQKKKHALMAKYSSEMMRKQEAESRVLNVALFPEQQW